MQVLIKQLRASGKCNVARSVLKVQCCTVFLSMNSSKHDRFQLKPLAGLEDSRFSPGRKSSLEPKMAFPCIAALRR